MVEADATGEQQLKRAKLLAIINVASERNKGNPITHPFTFLFASF